MICSHLLMGSLTGKLNFYVVSIISVTLLALLPHIDFFSLNLIASVLRNT